MAKISKNIKQLRQQRNMTQEELAQKLFVTRQAVSSWENDRTQPDIYMLGRLREVFGVSIEELLYGKKRNTTVEMEKPSYTNSLITVFSVLGSILVTAGLILIFVTGWEEMPEFFKKLLAFLPLFIGQAAGAFVLMKKREKKAWCEGGAVFWCIGIIASCALVQNVFDIYVFDQNFYLIMALAILPVVFLMKFVSALAAFYVTGLFHVYSVTEGVVFEAFGAVKYILCGLCSLVVFAVGIYLARILKQTDRESHRISIIYWITAIAFPLYGFFFVLVGNFELGSALIFVSAVLLSYFILGQKERTVTSPFNFLGFFGIAACVCLSSYVSVIGFDSDSGAGQIGLVAAQLIMILIALHSIRYKFVSKMHLLMAADYLVMHFLFLITMLLEDIPYHLIEKPEDVLIQSRYSEWADIAFVVMQIFALVFFGLMIAQGAADKKLTVMNTGFVGFTHQIIFWVAGSGLGMLTNGIVLLVCGGVLLFVNLKIAKGKNQPAYPIPVSGGKEAEADEK